MGLCLKYDVYVMWIIIYINVNRILRRRKGSKKRRMITTDIHVSGGLAVVSTVQPRSNDLEAKGESWKKEIYEEIYFFLL